MFQHGGLPGDIERLTQWMPKGHFQVNRSRRSNPLGIGSDDGYADGGDALSFNFPLDQSNGLVAQTSTGRQEHGIHMILHETAGHPGCRVS